MSADTHVLVPREPTEEMVRAFFAGCYYAGPFDFRPKHGTGWADNIRAAIAAAPPVEDQSEGLAADASALVARLKAIPRIWVGRSDKPDALCHEAANTISSLTDRLAAAEAENAEWKLVAKRAGVCMTCAIRAPEPYGCSDCLNTGWEQGAPAGYVGEAENAVLKADVERKDKALEPVARAASIYDPPDGDDRATAHAATFTVGVLRRAREAMLASRCGSERAPASDGWGTRVVASADGREIAERIRALPLSSDDGGEHG